MANERSAGPDDAGLLTARLDEQLREKAHLEEEAERERRAAEAREDTMERRKRAERETVAAHGGDPETFREARRTAHAKPVWRRPSLSTLLFLGAGVAYLVQAISRRMK